jgi:hypothetical protein
MYGGLCGGASQPCIHDLCAGAALETTDTGSKGTLLDDLVIAEDARADEGMAGDTMEPLSSMVDFNAPGWKVRGTRMFVDS